MTSMLTSAIGLANTAMAQVYVDTCTVTRPAEGKGTLGGSSGYAVIPPTPTTIYAASPCIATATAGGSMGTDGEGEQSSSRIRIRFPSTAPEVLAGDTITLDAVASLGGATAGLVLEVVRSMASSVGTSRFAVCERTEEHPTAGSAAL